MMIRGGSFVTTILFIFIQNVYTQRLPTISYISREQIKDVGGSVELLCAVQHAQEYPVLWTKVDHSNNANVLPISTGSSLIIHDSRFALRYNSASSSYVLRINDIQETDAGFYQCKVLTPVTDKIAAEVELQVRRPPIISDNSTRSTIVSEGEVYTQRWPTISYISQDQIKDIGGSVELLCSVQNAQEYPVLWMKVDHSNNANVLPISTGSSLIIHDSRFALRHDSPNSSYVLQINNIQETDAGFYQCQVVISVTNEIAAEVELQVQRPPIISDNSTRSTIVSEGEVNTQSRPIISYISREQFKDIGGSVQLYCSVQYAEEYSVLWTKVDHSNNASVLTISAGSSLIVHDSRFAIRYDSGSSSYVLQINDIEDTDAGFYQCQVLISVTDKIAAEVELQVRRPPVISDNSTRSIVVAEGEAVQLECYANGYPPPIVSWRRENNAILPTGGAIYRGNKLKIKEIKKEDRGTYYCVAKNGIGRDPRRNVVVEVEFKPVITVPEPRLNQTLEDDIDLECHIEAYPPAAITWHKDGIQLSNNQHFCIKHFATTDAFTNTTIHVTKIEKQHYGKYICKGDNKLGSNEDYVELFETIIPVCPPDCNQTLLEEQPLSLPAQ